MSHTHTRTDLSGSFDICPKPHNFGGVAEIKTRRTCLSYHYSKLAMHETMSRLGVEPPSEQEHEGQDHLQVAQLSTLDEGDEDGIDKQPSGTTAGHLQDRVSEVRSLYGSHSWTATASLWADTTEPVAQASVMPASPWEEAEVSVPQSAPAQLPASPWGEEEVSPSQPAPAQLPASPWAAPDSENPAAQPRWALHQLDSNCSCHLHKPLADPLLTVQGCWQQVGFALVQGQQLDTQQ